MIFRHWVTHHIIKSSFLIVISIFFITQDAVYTFNCRFYKQSSKHSPLISKSRMKTYLSLSMSQKSISSNSLKVNDHDYNIISSIKDVMSKYDYFIIDQWGVLHNGKVPYKGVIEALQLLKLNNKVLILLSNSSKQKSSSFKGLQKVGIDPTYFVDIVTSGELGFHMIKEKCFYNDMMSMEKNENQIKVNNMKKYFVIGNNDDDIDYFNKADCLITDIPQADVVLVRGTFSILTSMTKETIEYNNDILCNNNNINKKNISFKNPSDLLKNIDGWLHECRQYNLPMLVTNPDFYRPGNNEPMPGLIGAKYEALGGKVTYIGKPYIDVYKACLEIIHQFDKSSSSEAEIKGKICCIGDSLEHDILGAHNQGLNSIWIANGVHCNELYDDNHNSYSNTKNSINIHEGSHILPSTSKIMSLFSKLNIFPTHVVASFS